MKLLLGDCLDKLKGLDDNSIDSIVTDPPYGLSAAPNSGKKSKGGFMGKTWDYDVPSVEIWEECMRVLKPGGHLLAFAGSRTYHRMAVRIEDAGFEIRDQILWVYGSGFPKSMNISKYIDKKFGTEKIVGQGKAGKTALGQSSGYNKTYNPHEYNITEPGSELAEQWNGWGTALKPAHEPIVMARKPLSEKTVVDNVLEWGTGGINIDDSRISTNDNLGGGATKGSVLDIEGFDRPWMHDEEKMKEFSDKMKQKVEHAETLGRFPANVIFDEEAGKILDEQTGILKSGNLNAGHKRGVGTGNSYANGGGGGIIDRNYGGDEGGASRFFYCPKTSKRDRNEGLDGFELKQQDLSRKEGNPGGNNPRNRGVNKRQNHHPTVKPTDLMAYLVRLVTPKGGTVLDPFMGSGSTGKACVREGMDFIGIEMDEEYFKIANARIQYEIDNPIVTGDAKRVTINKNSHKFF